MRQRSTLIFLAVALAAVLPFAWSIAQPFATAFMLAAVLAMMVDGIHDRISARVQRPGPAALLTTLLTFLSLLIPLTAIGLALTRELADAYQRLNRMSMEGGGWQALFAQTTDHALEVMNGILPIDKVSLKAEAAGYLKQLAASMLQIAGAAFGGATSTIMTGLMVLLLLYFVVRYGHSWLRAVPSLLPLEPDVTAAIFRAVHDTIIANVNGLLVVAAAQGFLLGLGFWFLGLPSPVTWGLFGALASMIPVVGIVIVWLPFVIGLALMGRYVHAGVLAAWSVLIVGTIDNVIRPLVVRGRVNQHPMLIVLAIIGGTTAFGALGLVLGPVVVSLVIALAGEIRKRLPHYVEETQTP